MAYWQKLPNSSKAREEPFIKFFLHNKPCPLTSLLRKRKDSKSWEKFSFPFEKIRFKFFGTEKLIFAQKKFQILRMMFDQFFLSFKMFSIVELSELGGQNFKLGIYSKNV